MLGYTISFSFARFVHAGPSWRRRCAHEFWTHRLCSAFGSASATCLRSGGGSLSRRAACSPVLLHGSIAVHGLRPTHRPIQSARDRQLLCALGPRRYHCGNRAVPAKSILGEANEQRDYRIYMDTALSMIETARIELPVDPDLLRLKLRVRDRFHDHRPVPEAVPLGKVQTAQGGRQRRT